MASSNIFYDSGSLSNLSSSSRDTKETFLDVKDSASSVSVPTKIELRPLKVYIVTWNVGSKFPDNISLRNLLQLPRKNDVTPEYHQLPDLYAIGLQEVNAQPQNQVLNLFKEDPWTSKVKELLKDDDFVVVKTEQMQGLLLALLFKREHVPFLRDIEAEFTRTGFGGIWGNKGAVSIRFNLYGCAVTFVVAHLAAHDHHMKERIEDYNQILEHHHYHVKNYREIFDHDYIFWFGDLNFRLLGDDKPHDLRTAIESGEYSKLLKIDELFYVRQKTREAFHFLQERVPAFPPTFKFAEGTSEYDLKRRPAWTDRIVYAVQPLKMQPKLLGIEQISYKSHPDYNISDHKPVTSEFEIQLYKNHHTIFIQFHHIRTWTIGKEVTVVYTKPQEFEEKEHDWIGIYPSNYASFADYIGYEYVNQAETPPTDELYVLQPARLHHHKHQNRERLRREAQQNSELVRIDFSEDMNLKEGQFYVLIYFQNTGIRGITSISGISNEFRAEKKYR